MEKSASNDLGRFITGAEADGDNAILTGVLSPLASEYGIKASYDEFKTYITSLADQELGSEEIAQVAGGKGAGFGAAACYIIGAGLGGGVDGDDGDAGCCFIGFGNSYLACAVSGAA